MDLDTARQPPPRGALGRPDDAGPAVTALYQAHGVGLIRLAVVMLGDRPAAEDVVQEAFCGLYRRWHRLDDPRNALRYVRSSVLNGCRSALRNQSRLRSRPGGPQQSVPESAESAESTALAGEEHRAVLAALRRLPDRQREALVLRYYLELSEAQIAQSMGVSQGTVKSTVSRALAALGRLLGEGS
jgi:RNA polymerase sigma-70 factor (sigma-E family)